MSVSSEDAPGINMSKKARGSDDGNSAASTPVKLGDPGAPAFPLTLRLAVGAAIAQIVFNIAGAVSYYGFHDTFVRLLIKSNHDAKKPKNPYTAADIAKDLSHVRTGQLLQTVVGAIALLLLLYFLTRIRQATIGRWALVVISVLLGGPMAVIPSHGLPGLTNTLRVIAGLCAIVMIIMLIFPPQTQRYFRECREIARPGAAPARGLRDLFAPRPAPPSGGTARAGAGTARGASGGALARGGFGGLFARPAPSSARADANGAGGDSKLASRNRPTGAASAPGDSEPAPAARPGARAKARADDSAVAKGAQLARNRAKAASKSRRVER